MVIHEVIILEVVEVIIMVCMNIREVTPVVTPGVTLIEVISRTLVTLEDLDMEEEEEDILILIIHEGEDTQRISGNYTHVSLS